VQDQHRGLLLNTTSKLTITMMRGPADSQSMILWVKVYFWRRYTKLGGLLSNLDATFFFQVCTEPGDHFFSETDLGPKPK
jgi:hypothetical protein